MQHIKSQKDREIESVINDILLDVNDEGISYSLFYKYISEEDLIKKDFSNPQTFIAFEIRTRRNHGQKVRKKFRWDQIKNPVLHIVSYLSSNKVIFIKAYVDNLAPIYNLDRILDNDSMFGFNILFRNTI
jgi:hypothetical protein